MKKLTQSFSAVALGLGSLLLVTSAQAMDFGNMMNPSRWMGGNSDRNSDYGGGPGYGYGGPGGYGGGPGYGSGGPGGYGGGPGYGYGGPGGYGGGPGYGYGGPGR